MNQNYDDLHSLYRAAARQEQPTRADQRAVRTAILGAGVVAAALHTSTATAAGKLFTLIPGGAKVLTIGQVVAYAGLGVAVGGGLAAVGAAVTTEATVPSSSASVPDSVRQASKKANSQPGGPAANAEDPRQPDDVEPTAEPNPTPNPANADRPLSNGTTVVDRPAPSQRNAAPIFPANTPGAQPATPAAANLPSLVEESRGLAAVQTALGSHDAHRALALLDAQDRDYRAGSLGQERFAARVLALCMAGRKVEAMAARDRFMSSYPGSPLIRRVGAACKK